MPPCVSMTETDSFTPWQTWLCHVLVTVETRIKFEGRALILEINAKRTTTESRKSHARFFEP
jgi:hypothetical protein